MRVGWRPSAAAADATVTAAAAADVTAAAADVTAAAIVVTLAIAVVTVSHFALAPLVFKTLLQNGQKSLFFPEKIRENCCWCYGTSILSPHLISRFSFGRILHFHAMAWIRVFSSGEASEPPGTLLLSSLVVVFITWANADNFLFASATIIIGGALMHSLWPSTGLVFTVRLLSLCLDDGRTWPGAGC